jgi:hypothetical protein
MTPIRVTQVTGMLTGNLHGLRSARGAAFAASVDDPGSRIRPAVIFDVEEQSPLQPSSSIGRTTE